MKGTVHEGDCTQRGQYNRVSEVKEHFYMYQKCPKVTLFMGLPMSLKHR